MSTFDNLLTALKNLHCATEKLNTMKWLPSSPTKRYCCKCGLQMIRSEYVSEYDSVTGGRIVYFRFTCPRRRRFWFLRMFDWHQRYSTDVDGKNVRDPLDE